MTATEIYEKHRKEALEKGKSDGDARAYALRFTNHAGWFKKHDAWVQLHPDLRTKVNVREAFPQPDGTFVIYDIDCFYPNAVKGEDEVYDVPRLQRIIRNTNRAILAGGQKPGILEGHPNPLQAMNGMQMDSNGFGVNWRESPRGKGWLRCDLIHVALEYVDRLKAKKLTGLSAYIAKDAGKTNERVGHVALLGGSTQALSHLPTHDIYASCCFSADAAFFTGASMKRMSDKQKKCFSDVANAQAAYAAAQASFAAGEEGGDEKMKEAEAGCYAASQAFTSAFGEMDTGMTGGADGQAMPADADTAPAGFSADGQRPDLPAKSGLNLQDQDEPQEEEMFSEGALAELQTQFAEKPVDTFNVFTTRLKKFQEKQAAKLKRLTTANRLLQGKMVTDDFAAFCTGLQREGHQFDADSAKGMFAFALESANPAKALESVRAFLRKTPKAERLSQGDNANVFSAADAARAPGLRGPAKKMNQSELEKMAQELSEQTGRNFTVDDVNAYSAFSEGLLS